MDFVTVDGFEIGVVSYGSDVPELYNLGECPLYMVRAAFLMPYGE
ncbi:MAG: hypothetical protein R3A12_01955 [Ignavibacteria bacterium]